jgi:AbrB family looped-hinge helix DNA binding protein
MRHETTRIGKRGVVVIPADMRRHFGFEVGATVIAEQREDGVLLRPAVTLPIEVYSNERKAEFLLNNAVTDEDYARARDEVRSLGVNPDIVAHKRPMPSRKKNRKT